VRARRAAGRTTVDSIVYSNDTTDGILAWAENGSSGSYSNSVPITLTLSSQNSTLTSSVGTNETGPASAFYLNVEGVYVGPTSDQKVWLGSNSTTNSTATGTISSPLTLENTLALMGLIAIPTAGIVVIVLRRRHRPPARPEDFD
jgi:hypothetical protein